MRTPEEILQSGIDTTAVSAPFRAGALAALQALQNDPTHDVHNPHEHGTAEADAFRFGCVTGAQLHTFERLRDALNSVPDETLRDVACTRIHPLH